MANRSARAGMALKHRAKPFVGADRFEHRPWSGLSDRRPTVAIN
jgi:hypothetical protein